MSLDSQVAALPYESSSFATPKGALLPALCYELIMGANVEWRANLPLRGRCRRQKGCISIRHSLVGMFSLCGDPAEGFQVGQSWSLACTQKDLPMNCPTDAKGAVVWFYQKRRPPYLRGRPPQARRALLTSDV